MVESKSGFEIKEFPVDMPFPGEGVWLVNWLGNWVLEGGIGGYTQKWSTYIHMHDRLDKLHSALAEAQVKMESDHSQFHVLCSVLMQKVGILRLPVIFFP